MKHEHSQGLRMENLLRKETTIRGYSKCMLCQKQIIHELGLGNNWKEIENQPRLNNLTRIKIWTVTYKTINSSL